MSPPFRLAALLILASVPGAWAQAEQSRHFACDNAAGDNPFLLTFNAIGYYDIASGAGSSMIMFGGGSLPDTDTAGTYEVSGGPLENTLGALTLEVVSAGTLHITGPNGLYTCKKSKS